MNLSQFNRRNLRYMSFNVCSTKAAFLFKVILIGAFICCSVTAMAQRRSHAALTYGGGGGGTNFDSGYGVTFGFGVDAPLGNLKDVYKAAPAYDLSVVRFLGDFTVGLNLGYHVYKPKDDVASAGDITIDGNADGTVTVDNGTTVFSNYKVYSAYASAVYNVDLSDDTRLYGGANIGLYVTHYAFAFTTDDGNYAVAELRDRNIYLAPRLGVIFALTENIGLSFDARYNFFAPTSNTQYESSGSFYTSMAGQVGLTYKF
ncbi:outer membrane protein [Mucilaginibacter sp. SP1R1]|uniref:outer membrane protein n=1 Tax=Mucilaginibacter sp. SP1R1 TaxID=2723091 RepID=UPI0017AAC050|nr:outer membrane beta-barrel protein [Mucilaginibacter sp. SP1R1]MBB6149633.1 hypothetical protein [Mucilaginibacter sp. SP1R1]